MVCPYRQGKRELSHCEHFANKGRGSIFDFVRTSFMDSPLRRLQILLYRHIRTWLIGIFNCWARL